MPVIFSDEIRFLAEPDLADKSVIFETNIGNVLYLTYSCHTIRCVSPGLHPLSSLQVLTERFPKIAYTSKIGSPKLRGR